MTSADEVAAELALRFADAHGHDIDAIVTDALRDLAGAASADRAYVTLYHDDGTFENTHEWTAQHVVPQLPAIQRLRADDFPYSYEAVRRGEVFAAPDLSALPDTARAEQRSFSSFGVRAVLQVPITIDGEGIGLIGVNHFQVVDGWDDDFVGTVGRVGRVIAVVLHQRRSVRAARKAYEEAARANRIKEQLLTQLGHELRTPLHAILGYAELLELEDRPAEDRDALLQIQFQGRHLLTLVEDLVALAHDGAVPAEDVALAPLVSTVVDGVRDVAERRGIHLTIGEGLGEAQVHAEAGRLRQVLYCLVSGAVQRLEAESSLCIDASPSADLRIVVDRVSGTVDEWHDDADIVVPLARTLVDGYGSLRVVRASEVRVTVEVAMGGSPRDGQPARP